MNTQSPEGATRLNLAVPPDIRAQLETLAERHRRSLSAEVCCDPPGGGVLWSADSTVGDSALPMNHCRPSLVPAPVGDVVERFGVVVVAASSPSQRRTRKAAGGDSCLLPSE
jgi:hypothetical protein